MSPARTWRSLRSGLQYTVTDDLAVRVVNPRLNREGLFDRDGRWLSGELRHCGLDQHHMILWLTGLETVKAAAVETHIPAGKF
jgi:hypothetical protein